MLDLQLSLEDLNDNYTQNLYKTQEVGARYFSNTGGTMTGDLTLAEDVEIIFEGATDDAHETKLTVADPTADRTITLPNVTGTVVTTGDTGTVTATMLAANSVDSSELVNGSVDLSHMSANSVDSDQYVNGSIDLVHMSANSVDSDQYVDGSIDTVHIADNAITDDKLDTNIRIAGTLTVDGITTLANQGLVTGSQFKIQADNSELAVNAGDGSNKFLVDSDTGNTNIAGNLTVAGTTSLAAGSISATELATDAVEESKIKDLNVSTDKIANDAITIGKIGCEQTTISNSDSHIPTSGAVIDYVTAQISPIGGLEVIATEDNFPTSMPAAGVVISISDAAGIVVNGSGVSTTARTDGNGSDNVQLIIFQLVYMEKH